MIVYSINLMFVWIMSVLAVRFGTKNNSDYENSKLPNGIFVFFIFLSLFLVCGLRWYVGTDYGNYIDIYNINRFKSLSEILLGEEPGFMFITWIASRNGYYPEIMFLICAFITTMLMILAIRKYATMFEMSIFLYITHMVYYTQFNGMRQAMAVAIMFLGFKYIYRNSFKKYLLTIIIASTIHSSAIFFIPIYFIVRLKPWSKKIILVISAFIISFILFEPVMNILFSVGGKYQTYFSLKGNYSSYGVNPIRVVVTLMPVLIGFIFRKKFKLNSVQNNILINFSLLNLLFMLLATKNVGLSRMCMYFTPYSILLIPEFVKVEKTKFRYLIYAGIVITFYIYMIGLLPVDSNLLPYRTIFNK